MFSEHGDHNTSSKQYSSEPILIKDDACDLDPKGSDISRAELPKHKKIIEQPFNRKTEGSKALAPNTEDASNSPDVVTNSAVTCIPETQICFTPPGSNKVSTDSVKISPQTNDFGLIPDTPQDKKQDVVKTKRPLARSFLLSTSQMGSNPIQKAKEHRQEKLAMKKRASLARKSLLSVSVQFNQDENKKWNSTAENVQLQSDTNVDKRVDSEQVIQGEVSEGKTPTKIYCDGNSMKRMAKSGSSPDSKRLSDGLGNSESNQPSIDEKSSLGNSVCRLNFEVKSDRQSSGDTNIEQPKISIDETDFKSAKSMLQNTSVEKSREELMRIERKKEKEKQMQMKKEKERLEKMRVTKEENRRKSEKLMKYQLTGVTGL